MRCKKCGQNEREHNRKYCPNCLPDGNPSDECKIEGHKMELICEKFEGELIVNPDVLHEPYLKKQGCSFCGLDELHIDGECPKKQGCGGYVGFIWGDSVKLHFNCGEKLEGNLILCQSCQDPQRALRLRAWKKKGDLSLSPDGSKMRSLVKEGIRK